MREFLDSTDATNDPTELYARLRRDGYLFLRNVIPANLLAAARRELLAIARENNWLLDAAPAEIGIANVDEFCVEPEPAYRKVFQRMYCLESIHAIPHHPNLVGLFERMLGGAVLPHPRIQLRAVFPTSGDQDYSTRPHQDFLHVQGTAETFTAWIPLSDCGIEMGSLGIAERSHAKGLYDFKLAPGYGLVEVLETFPDDRWVTGNYELGDLSIHHSMTVHKALPNTTNHLRLSLDCRYQLASEPINEKCLNPNAPPLTWKNIYAGWRRQDLQYYWHNWELTVASFDASANSRRDQMALEAAARGERNALPAVKLIARTNADPDKRRLANELLQTFGV